MLGEQHKCLAFTMQQETIITAKNNNLAAKAPEKLTAKRKSR